MGKGEVSISAEISRKEIEQAMNHWKNALNRFHWVDPTNPMMVDAAIYEYNAALARYQALLHQGKLENEQRMAEMQEAAEWLVELPESNNEEKEKSS